MEETLARVVQITIAISVAFGVVLWFSLVVWAYRDIVRRTDSALVQIFSTVLVILGFVPGAIVYLLLRPNETLAERYQREVESTFLEHEMSSAPVCPECETLIRDEYQFCPNCGLELRQACPSCGRLAEIDWQVCAFCGVDLDQPARQRDGASPIYANSPSDVNASEWEVELEPTGQTQDSGDLQHKDFDWETVARSEHQGKRQP